MDDLGRKIEEIINEANNIHMITLQHAAEISPFVTERTIGPDIAIISDQENNITEKKDECIQEKNTINEKKTPKKQLVENYALTKSLQSIDLQTISSGFLRQEAEVQRRRAIRQQVLDMEQRHRALMRQKLVPLQQQRREERRKWLEQKRHNDSQIIQLAEEQAAKELQEHEHQLEALRKQTQRQLQLISFQGVSQYQAKFSAKYEAIAHLLMSLDKQAIVPCVEFNVKLREQIQMFEQLIGKMKNGECGTAELKMAESLCLSLEALERNILEACRQEQMKRIEDMKLREQQQQQQQQQQPQQHLQQQQQQQLQQQQLGENTITPSINEVLIKTEQQQPQQQQQQQQQPLNDEPDIPRAGTSAAAAAATSTTTANMFSSGASPERLEFYTTINTFYQEKVEKVKVLQSDESMKKYRFDCQKSINIPVNAISAVSQQHIRDKFDKLYTFVMSQTNLGRDYCVLLMAKKFVGQGETTISSNPLAAFPVASVVVSLWKQIPEFGQLFLAYVFKESPFMVPYFIPQKSGQSWEEYAKVLGYRITEGQLEPQDMYLKRQAGIVRLYAAVMVTQGRKQDGPHHPYGLQHAWRWLSNMVQLNPLPDICATLIMEFLQILGNDLWTTYGRQFSKLLVYIQTYYFPKLSEVDEGGPKARLELLLNKSLREGQIPKPQGMLPPDFW